MTPPEVCRPSQLCVLLGAALTFACVDLTPPPELVRCTTGGCEPDADAPDAPADAPPGTDAPVRDVLPPDVSPMLPQGRACANASQCASGFCVDGVCCLEACTGSCRTCNGAGTCVPVTAGMDPDDECPTEAPTTCARDGTCDGAGSCRLHAVGTKCAEASCAGTMESSERTCDGLGVCRPASVKPCDPYVCNGTRCGTSCTMKEQCVPSSFCETGTMKCSGLLPAGAACTTGTACVSGFCVDGVCCNTACTGKCAACNLPGSTGVCAPVAAGEDPANDCPTQAPQTCGTDGSCDGRGGCRLFASNTSCVAASCTGGKATLPSTCNGNGACNTPMTQSCAPYLCAGTTCANACANDGACVAGNFCQDTVCRPKLTGGQTCTRAGECQSGFCANGVCCDGACTDACKACNVAGSAGICAANPAALAAVPATLSASGVPDKVQLTWATSAGATSYTVKRSTTSGSGYMVVAMGLTGTSHTDTAVTNGTTYHYVVTATNGCGESAPSMQASATPTRTALLVVGDTSSPGDTQLRTRLEAKGFVVVVVSDTDATAANAAGKAVVVVSESSGSNTVAGKFRDVPVPVIILEPYVLDDMGMTGPTSSTDYILQSGQTTVAILTSSHPLAAGLTGTVSVVSTASSLAAGKPAAAAAKVATLTSDTSQIAIFGYEAGAMMSAFNAPARRVSFFAGNAAAGNLNANGVKLLDAAISWAAGL